MHAEPVYSSQDYALSFQRGEEKGFSWFFRQLYPALTLFAGKIIPDRAEAEEIASESFIKIWRRHNQFNDPESIRAYLYQIVRNDAYKWFRKEQQKKGALSEIKRTGLAEQSKTAFQSLILAETMLQLQRAIGQLPPQCSKVIRLIYLEDKNLKETAKEMGLSLSTVKTQKKRGLAALRKIMPQGISHLTLFILISIVSSFL